MSWSIDVQGESPFEVGGLVLRVLQDRYRARIDGYDVSEDGRVSVAVGLPSDPWTRRIVLHWAQVDRNAVMAARARELTNIVSDHASRVSAYVHGVRQRLAIR